MAWLYVHLSPLVHTPFKKYLHKSLLKGLLYVLTSEGLFFKMFKSLSRLLSLFLGLVKKPMEPSSSSSSSLAWDFGLAFVDTNEVV